jgi:hypothetical protein
MSLLSQTEATSHLAVVTNEIDRLRERFQMRPILEKRRMAALEALAPKLHRLVKGTGYETDALSPKDTALLASLAPKAVEKKEEKKDEPKKKPAKKK